MGIGDWGLGIGDWGLGPIPNPQTPIPNPHLKPIRKTSFNFKYLNNIYCINAKNFIFIFNFTIYFFLY